MRLNSLTTFGSQRCKKPLVLEGKPLVGSTEIHLDNSEYADPPRHTFSFAAVAVL